MRTHVIPRSRLPERVSQIEKAGILKGKKDGNEKRFYIGGVAAGGCHNGNTGRSGCAQDS